MKTIFKYLLSAFLFFCIESKAQEVGTHNAIPSKNSAKGRREVRKDKRIKRHTEREEKRSRRKLEAKSDNPLPKEKTRKTAKQHKERQ